MDTVNELIGCGVSSDDEPVAAARPYAQDNSEKIAADPIISQKRMGGLQAARAPSSRQMPC